MRRRARFVVLVLLLASGIGTRAQQDPDGAADPLLLRLEVALRTGAVAAFIEEMAPALPDQQRQWLLEVAPAGADAVTIRARSRSGRTVITDVLIARGDRAVVASWRLVVAPGISGRLTLESVIETSRIGDLIRFELDISRQFTVRDLIIEGPGFRLTLPSGTAFAGTVDGSITALVLRGRSTVRFAPTDPTEQGQLRIFGGSTSMNVTADDVFVRINPSEAQAIVRGTLQERPRVDPGALGRMRRVFEERAALGHGIDVGDLSSTRWALNVRPGSLLVEFRTRRDGWLTYSRSPDAEQDISLADRARRRQVSLYASRPAGGDPALTATLDAPYRVVHTDLDLVFDPDRLWLRGRASLRLRVDAPTSGLVLRLAGPLRVISMSSPTLGPLLFVRSTSEGGLLVGLPRALDATETVTVDVQFQGVLSSQHLEDEAPDVRRVADVPSPLGLAPRFLYSNDVAWYPQVALNRHATATMRITVPSAFDIVATGRRGETVFSAFAEEPTGSGARQARTVTFTADRPVRYLAFLVASMAPSTRVAAPDQAGVAVDVFAAPGSGGARRPTAQRVHEIVSFYTDVLGEAPYPSLTVAALDDQIPSGHSPAYFALMNYPLPLTPYSWDRDPVAFDDVPDFFLAHEVAHQWWGQAVAGRDYREQWISEGFAQYMAWLYVTSAQGIDAGERVMARMRASAEGLDLEGPIRLGFRLGHLRNDRRVFRAIVYNKAAVVLHMLRRLIGEEAFFAGLRHVIATHRFTLIGTTEVQQAFQAQTDLPLQRFFTRWVRGATTPQLRFTWSSGGDGTIVIDVEQRGPVFDLPYAAVVHYADGSRQRVPLVITAAAERFAVPAVGVVRRVEFGDPMTPARLVR